MNDYLKNRYQDVPIAVIERLSRMATNLNLDPTRNEIMILSRETGEPFIFIPRDIYRRVVREHPDYDFHWVAPIYENDTLRISNGIPELTSGSPRGRVSGAYGVIKRKDSSSPLYMEVSFEEFEHEGEFWDGMPALMIMKACEVQVIKLGFPELFAESYAPAEVTTGKKVQSSAIDFIKAHSDIAMKYIKKKGLHDMGRDELMEIVSKIKEELGDGKGEGND